MLRSNPRTKSKKSNNTLQYYGYYVRIFQIVLSTGHRLCPIAPIEPMVNKIYTQTPKDRRFRQADRLDGDLNKCLLCVINQFQIRMRFSAQMVSSRYEEVELAF